MTTATQHLTDADLLAFIDDDSQVQGAQPAHLLACALCMAEADRLRADAALLTQWLGSAAFEAGGRASRGTVPSVGITRPGEERSIQPAAGRATRPGALRGRSGSTAWLKAAAVIALVAAPVAALPGARAWLSAQFGGAVPAAPAADASTEHATTVEPAAIVRFVPAGSSLSVTFSAAQGVGVLSVRPGDGDEVTLSISDAAITPVVSDAGVTIPNIPASSASYTLTVPRSVTRLVVRVAGSTAVLDAAVLRAGADLPVR